MKKNYYLSSSLTLVMVSQSEAQSCGNFFPLTSQTYEIKLYKREGEPTGSYIYEVLVNGSGKATLTRYQLKKNGKVFERGMPHTFTCGAQNTVLIPDSTTFPAMSIGKMIMPEKLEVGQTLPETNQNYFYDKRKPEKKMGFVSLYNIKVTKKETITVPAGTFEAYLIEYDRKFGQMLMGNVTSQVKEWYSPGKGLVKIENYMSGKLITRGELTTVTDKPFATK